MCGKLAEAEKFIAENSDLFPTGTLWNAVRLPEIRAAIEIQCDRPNKAIEPLASAVSFEPAYPETVYLRGKAYLRLRKGSDEANGRVSLKGVEHVLSRVAGDGALDTLINEHFSIPVPPTIFTYPHTRPPDFGVTAAAKESQQ